MGQAMTVIAALATALEKARRGDEAEVPVRAPERAPAGLSDVRALAQLPVIGGSDFDAERVAALIASEAFQARYERGMSVSVYVAANDAFRTAGRTMRCPIYKVGICASERLHQRQLELDRDGYGSMLMQRRRAGARSRLRHLGPAAHAARPAAVAGRAPSPSASATCG